MLHSRISYYSFMNQLPSTRRVKILFHSFFVYFNFFVEFLAPQFFASAFVHDVKAFLPYSPS